MLLKVFLNIVSIIIGKHLRILGDLPKPWSLLAAICCPEISNFLHLLQLYASYAFPNTNHLHMLYLIGTRNYIEFRNLHLPGLRWDKFECLSQLKRCGHHTFPKANHEHQLSWRNSDPMLSSQVLPVGYLQERSDCPEQMRKDGLWDLCLRDKFSWWGVAQLR
jgi:hypothetical protein